MLVLCTGNSARSQMAEGLINHFVGDVWQAKSAGTAPAERVHPLAIVALDELGIDISQQRPKHTDALRGVVFDVVVTVCGDADENCPVWLREGRVMHIGFPDPAVANGTPDEQLAVFREVRDGLRERVVGFLMQETHR